MGGFSNFAVSFTIISVLSGCLTLYYFGMSEGGPVDMVWGWIIVGVMTTIVGLGMAEIASKYPTAGGLYYWSAKLAKTNPGAWSWFTGWFNLLGQVAVTAGIDYGFAFFFTAFLNSRPGLQRRTLAARPRVVRVLPHVPGKALADELHQQVWSKMISGTASPPPWPCWRARQASAVSRADWQERR
jgi:amino acid transporter